MNDTKIEWTDKTWNPITGCSGISPGCNNCYARRLATRLRGRSGYHATHPFRVTVHAKRFGQPLKWKKACRIFVCSMGDLYHPDVPSRARRDVWRVIHKCPQHTFFILTKRPLHISSHDWLDDTLHPPHHVLVGVSIESASEQYRLRHLRASPAGRLFLSCEPLLGPLDLSHYLCLADRPIEQVIVGGETGPGARPMDLDWARDIRDQCLSANVPFFFKSPGGHPKPPDRTLDGRLWEQFP